MLKFDLFAVDNFEKKTPMEFKNMSEVIDYFGHGEFSLADLSLTSNDGVQKLHPRNYEAKFGVQNYVAARHRGHNTFSATILTALGLETERGPVDDHAKFIADELKLGQSMATNMEPQTVGDQKVFFFHYWDKDLYQDVVDEWLPHKEVLEKRGLAQGSLQYKDVAVLADPERHLVAIVDLTGKANTYKELCDRKVLTKGPVVNAFPSTMGYIDTDFPMDFYMAGPREALKAMVERVEYDGDYGGPHMPDEEKKGTNSHDVFWEGYCNSPEMTAGYLEVRSAIWKTKADVYFYPDSKDRLEVYKVDRAVMDALGASEELFYSHEDIDEDEVFSLKEGDYVAGFGDREHKGGMRRIEPEEMRTLVRAKGDDAVFDVPF